MSVLFEGWYGRQNAGDDAFVVLANHVAATVWSANSWRFNAPSQALSRLGVDSSHALDHPRFRGGKRLLAGLRSATSRHVCYFGGTTLHGGDARARDLSALQRARVATLSAASVSFGPFDTAAQERSASEFVRRFSRVYLRDNGSHERARQAMTADRVRQAFDVAVLLPDVFPMGAPAGPRSSGRPRLAVTLCRDDPRAARHSAGDLARQEHLRQLIERIASGCGRPEVAVVVMNGDPGQGDGAMSREFASSISNLASVSVVDYSLGLGRTVGAIASSDLVISTRLHGSVFAYAYDVPFIAIPYHPKCLEFARTVASDELLCQDPNGRDLADIADVAIEIAAGGRQPALRVSSADARAAVYEALEWVWRGTSG